MLNPGRYRYVAAELGGARKCLRDVFTMNRRFSSIVSGFSSVHGFSSNFLTNTCVLRSTRYVSPLFRYSLTRKKSCLAPWFRSFGENFEGIEVCKERGPFLDVRTSNQWVESIDLTSINNRRVLPLDVVEKMFRRIATDISHQELAPHATSMTHHPLFAAFLQKIIAEQFSNENYSMGALTTSSTEAINQIYTKAIGQLEIGEEAYIVAFCGSYAGTMGLPSGLDEKNGPKVLQQYFPLIEPTDDGVEVYRKLLESGQVLLFSCE